MNDLSALTKAPIPFTIGDREYRISPLDFKDLGELTERAQWYPLEQAKRGQKHLPPELLDAHKETLLSLYQQCAKATLSLSSPSFFSYLAESSDGVAHTLYLSLRHQHPDISKDDVERLLTVGTVGGLVRTVLISSGLAHANEDIEKKVTEAPTPTQS